MGSCGGRLGFTLKGRFGLDLRGRLEGNLGESDGRCFEKDKSERKGSGRYVNQIMRS